jgi:hypothetical protein
MTFRGEEQHFSVDFMDNAVRQGVKIVDELRS